MKIPYVCYTQNDTLPFLTGQLENDDGSPLSLAGWGVQLHIQFSSENVLIKTAVVTDEENGVFYFKFDEGDLSLTGTFPAEIQLTSADGVVTAKYTEPLCRERLKFKISKEIA